MMRDIYKAVKVTDKVYWVGVIDWTLKDFHGYSTHRGSTYNAYLVLADRVTLIDTVKAPFRDELLSRINSVIDPTKIDYIISNHSEMDHTGSLPEVVDILKPEKVFASKMGAKAIASHFSSIDVEAVEDLSELDLGGLKVKFIETRMLHWPDSMFSYIEEERVLFSQDAFGMHLATAERFDDELPEGLLYEEAATYYANILMPYSHLVLKLLDRVTEIGLAPKIVAPDHGPIWRKKIGWILELYKQWAERKPERKVVIVFDTMWKSTELMARAIAEGAIEAGASVKLMSIRSSHRSDIATEVLNAGALVVGSPTINNNMFPTVADVLYYLKGLKPKGLVGAGFGSYGWSGESVKQIEEILKEMKVELVGEGLKVQYVPGEDDLEKCRELGKKVADAIGR